MIQNLEIARKLSEKTEADPVTHDLIETLLNTASEGKPIKKLAEKEIDRITKKETEG